jgi:RimJ/RimL family protein N-acetyltransferase
MLIETKRLVLRPIEPEDAQFLADLINGTDPRANDGPYTLIFPVSKEIEERWISKIGSRDDEAHLLIEKRKGGEPIGAISVTRTDRRNASASIGILLKEEYRDQDYGTEAVRATTKFMFDHLNVHRVWLRVNEGNSRAIRCCEKSGFSIEGVLREDHMRDGRWNNSLIMSILSDELEEKR